MGEGADGKIDGAGEWKADVPRNPPHQRNVLESALADSPSDPLPARLYAWQSEVRKEVIDPLLVCISRKRSYFNVIRSHFIILLEKDI